MVLVYRAGVAFPSADVACAFQLHTAVVPAFFVIGRIITHPKFWIGISLELLFAVVATCLAWHILFCSRMLCTHFCSIPCCARRRLSSSVSGGTWCHSQHSSWPHKPSSGAFDLSFPPLDCRSATLCGAFAGPCVDALQCLDDHSINLWRQATLALRPAAAAAAGCW